MFTQNDAISLFGGGEGRQILDYLARQGFASSEYSATGSRQYSLRVPVEAIKDVASVWQFIKSKSIQKPTSPDILLQQLAMARLKGNKLTLFSPWGPRYNRTSTQIVEEDPEVATLRELRTKIDEFENKGFSIDFLLMPADSYGIEINGRDSSSVRDYFRNLEATAYEILGENRTRVECWSSIKGANAERYAQLQKKVNDSFEEIINENDYLAAVKVAKVFNPQNAEESARKYCIERVVEGILVDELYSPIKVSLVRKEKDVLDGPLKRVYIVGIEQRAPWLRGD